MTSKMQTIDSGTRRGASDMRATRKRRKDARPAEILHAALAVFAQNGFHAASMEEIGARAGVSKGTVYLYFGSKEQLFIDTMRSVVDPLLEKGEFTVVEWSGPMPDLLHQLMLGWRKLAKDNPVGDVLKLMLAEGAAFPALARQGELLIGRVHAIVRKLIERGIGNGEFRPCDPELTARIILAPLGLREICRAATTSFCVAATSDEAYFSAYIDIVLHALDAR